MSSCRDVEVAVNSKGVDLAVISLSVAPACEFADTIASTGYFKGSGFATVDDDQVRNTRGLK